MVAAVRTAKSGLALGLAAFESKYSPIQPLNSTKHCVPLSDAITDTAFYNVTL